MLVGIASGYLKNAKFEFFVNDLVSEEVEPLRPLITKLRDDRKMFSDWYMGNIKGECKYWLSYKDSEHCSNKTFNLSEIPTNEEDAVEFFAVMQVSLIGKVWNF